MSDQDDVFRRFRQDLVRSAMPFEELRHWLDLRDLQLSESVRRALEGADFSSLIKRSQGEVALVTQAVDEAQSEWRYLSEEFNRGIASHLESLGQAANAAKTLAESWHSLYAEAAGSFERILTPQVAAAFESLARSPLAGLGLQLEEDYRRFLETGLRPDTFASELIDRLGRLRLVPKGESIDEPLDDLVEYVEKTAEGAKRPAAFIELLSLVLMMLFFAYQEASARKSSQDLIKRLAASEQRILTAVDSQRTNLPGVTFLEAKQSCDARRRPRLNSTVVARVAAGEVVQQVEAQPYWVHVEFLDYKSGELRRGWVARRNLREWRVLAIRPLEDVMDGMAHDAQERGLTPEILEEILGNEE